MAVFEHGAVHIAILVDTQAILGGQTGNTGNIVFMVDDNQSGGSTGEGTAELNTACNPGDTLLWRVSAINGTDTVAFLAFRNTNGDVFGFNPPQGGPSQFQATAINPGQETYQILILVNSTATFSWDPFVNCT